MKQTATSPSASTAIGSHIDWLIAAENGQTLILITHSGEVTATLPRVVTLRDGHVVSDERREEAGTTGV